MPAEGERDLPLEIGHVLFVDIVGYSKLLIDEQSELLQHLNEMVRSSEEVRAAETAGKLIRLATGDGMALVFRNNPEAPVQCAVELFRADKAHPELELRMGIHSGPINQVTDVNERANVTGAGINMAQRVMDCGDAGHILLSKRAADDLAQYRHWQPLLHDLGEVEVKHGVRLGLVSLYTDEVGNAELPQKLREQAKRQVPWPAIFILLVSLGATIFGIVLFYRNSPPPATHATEPADVAIPEKSIAVLPFENLSSDKENAYFADGIQDEILTRLSKIADLKVISRTSTQHYKSSPDNVPEIGTQLRVAHIVEGNVQKSGDKVRVNVQLIKAADDSHLWAESYDRKLTDIFSVESEVAKTIADQLRAKITGEEEQVIAARPTDNPAAYDAYLRGLAYTLKTQNTPANSLGAQKYLREATRWDPKFALSWALLSNVDAVGYIGLTLQQTPALREEARNAADTALNLQPKLGEGLLAKGYYLYAYLKDYDGAVRYFEQAREFLPNSSRIPESLAFVARRRGHWDRSELYFNQAERLDPRNVSLLNQHALSYLILRRFSETLQKLDQVLNITPDDVDTIALKASVAQAEGDLPRAAALLAPMHPAADDTPALETQVYQAILERRPQEIIPWLRQILAKPDPALGYYVGELRFWLGWAEQVAGDHSAAEETWQQARSELEVFLKEQPENYSLLGDLALVEMGLGDKTAALAFAERAMAANPVEEDPLDGPVPIEIYARVAAQLGEPDRALPALEKLLSIPYEGALPSGNAPLTPALLRLDPMFDPLRSDARFQKLAESPLPKQDSP